MLLQWQVVLLLCFKRRCCDFLCRTIGLQKGSLGTVGSGTTIGNITRSIMFQTFSPVVWNAGSRMAFCVDPLSERAT